MRATRYAFPLMAMLLGAAPALAGDDPKPKPTPNPDKMICEDQEVLGSRLATKRVCMTRAQWAEQRRADRLALSQSSNGGCKRQDGC